MPFQMEKMSLSLVIMEHIERAGVHSGDSMAAYPPQTTCRKLVQETTQTTPKRYNWS